MDLLVHVRILGRRWRSRIIRRVLAHRVQHRNPTLLCHHSAIWDYAYGDLDAIEIGEHVSVGANAEILVYKHSPHSSKEGRLIIGNRSVISTGANLRAAGGTIRIGSCSVIAQHCVLVAANHTVLRGRPYLYNAWDESRVGIEIGDNVWVAAGCVILPGARIGDNAVVGAGSVVRGEVPANEIWAGNPARKIKDVPAPVAAGVPPRPSSTPAPLG